MHKFIYLFVVCYLFLNVILPLLRSYADNSHITESPTIMRTKFLRIFPEIVISTTCLDGSISTRNMALGSDSITFPLTCKCENVIITTNILSRSYNNYIQ